MANYYSEDTILRFRDALNKIKGNILMDYNNELYTFEDYHIESVTSKVGMFKHKEITKFRIKWIRLSSGDQIHHYENDNMCSFYGVTVLMDYHNNWTNLQNKLVKFCQNSGVSLKF